MRIIDTGDKILSGDCHPQLKIGNKLYTVDDRKSTWDKIQEIQADESIPDDKKDEKLLTLALGKDAYKEITGDKDFSVSGNTALIFYVMSAITGEDYEELKKAARERKN